MTRRRLWGIVEDIPEILQTSFVPGSLFRPYYILFYYSFLASSCALLLLSLFTSLSIHLPHFPTRLAKMITETIKIRDFTRWDAMTRNILRATREKRRDRSSNRRREDKWFWRKRSIRRKLLEARFLPAFPFHYTGWRIFHGGYNLFVNI